MQCFIRACAILVLLCAASAGARGGVPEVPRFRLLGVQEGLPSLAVTAIARDRAGYVWVATADGLARYDGVGFRVWRHGDDPRSLPGNFVQALHVDAQDNVWVATEFGGISRLDAARDGFTHLRRATHPGIGSDDTWAFASRDRVVWFGTADGGLHRLAPDGRITRWTTREGLPSDTILTLAFAADGSLWIGTDAGLAQLVGGRIEAVPLPGDNAAPFVYSLTRDGDALWVGTASGVFRRDARGAWSMPSWSPMFERPNALTAIVRDADGGLWIGSQRGLWRMPRDGVPAPVAPGGPGFVKAVQSLLLDRGALWTPVAGVGLGYLRADWRRIAQFARPAASLGTDLYRALAPARDHGLWLAGNDGMVEHLGGDGTLARLPQAAQGPLARHKLSAVLEDAAGGVWIGYDAGLVRAAGGTVSTWTSDASRDPVPEGQIDQLRLAPDRTLWLSAQGGGVQQRDTRTGRVLAEARVGEDPALGSGDTEALEIDASGRPWIAGGQGLARWDPLRGRFALVAAMRGERVHAFAFDGPDALWLHRVAGLEHYRRDGAEWTRDARVGSAQQLPPLESAALRVDAAHRVWLSTRRGVFRWDPRAARLRRFGVEDGLGSQEFADRALALTPQGTLAGATADGAIVLLDTTAREPMAAVPQLRIDTFDVRRDGRWEPWPDGVPMRLSPSVHEWRVRLRMLAYEDPGATRYWTRLDGFDHGWVSQEGGDRIFAGIPAGRYTLRARAMDAAGHVAREQMLRIVVLPPWWRSGWMAALLLIAAAFALWRASHAWQSRQAQARTLQRIAHDRELAQAASQAKTDFLATFGHEVRTPMTGVLGMAELLLGTPLAAKQRGYAEAILGAGRHLLRLVDDALDLARIEAGRLELVEADFDLHALLAELEAMFVPLAIGKGLAFECDVAADLPRLVRGDGHRVRQILLNLCNNAVKFTAQGRIVLRAVALPRGVRLEVRDTGPGMDAQAQARLFRRFEQADGARTAARYGGSGLGLAICRELATAMGGSISMESGPGEGTTFRVELPLAAVARTARAEEPEGAHTGGLSVLLVEDDRLVAEAVRGLLAARGHVVTHAAHALDALAALQAQAFEVALLDLDLPGVDGLELARLLRSLGHALPLLALTARADAGAESLALAAGMDGFLRKPVTGERLARAIVDAIATRTSPPEAAMPA